LGMLDVNADIKIREDREETVTHARGLNKH